MKKLLHFFAFFFSTLISHYSLNLGFAPFVIISLFLFLILTLQSIINYNVLKKINVKFALFFLPILISGLLVSAFSLYPFLFSRLIVFIYIPIVLIYLETEKKRNFYFLKFSVYLTLKIHLFAFYLQAFYFYSTNKIIDFVEPITGEASRLIGGTHQPVFGDKFIRLSGLFTEPGTYVSVVFTLYLFYKIICTKTSGILSIKFRFLDFFIFVSVLLSFSTFGYIFLLFFTFMNLYKFDVKKILILFCIIFISTLLSYDYFYNRFLSQNQYLDDYRLEVMINFFYNQFSYSKIIFGYGFFSNFKSNILYVIDDVGFYFNLLFYFGTFIFLYFTFIISKRWKYLSAIERTLLFCLLISKLNFFYIFFIFYLFIFFYNEKSLKSI